MGRRDRRRIENARRLMKLLDRDPLHAEQVRFIAMRLFDELAGLHRLDERRRDCLEAASLLHDIGYSRDAVGHHKHSALLIRESGIEGFSARELGIIALTARYHRKGGPKQDHEDFNALPRDGRSTVLRLSALLQIADGLDRSHRAAVLDVTTTVSKSSVQLSLTAGIPITAELEAMKKKAVLFREVYGKNISAVVRVFP